MRDHRRVGVSLRGGVRSEVSSAPSFNLKANVVSATTVGTEDSSTDRT